MGPVRNLEDSPCSANFHAPPKRDEHKQHQPHIHPAQLCRRLHANPVSTHISANSTSRCHPGSSCRSLAGFSQNAPSKAIPQAPKPLDSSLESPSETLRLEACHSRPTRAQPHAATTPWFRRRSSRSRTWRRSRFHCSSSQNCSMRSVFLNALIADRTGACAFTCRKNRSNVFRSQKLVSPRKRPTVNGLRGLALQRARLCR